MTTLEERIKEHAHALGFELASIAAAGPADTFAQFQAWLAAGSHGEMTYLTRHAQAREHPTSILPEVRSILMLGMNYLPDQEHHASSPGIAGPGSARVARYALGTDYHDVIRRRLNELLAWIKSQVPDCHGRGVVDTAPLLERDFARRAGLGWFGKNTMLLNKRLGSYFFLAALLLDLELQADAAHDKSHCGTCTACLDACPTNAFPSPGVLDARRCISYLTIELRGPVPEELRPHIDDWLFGCDICQEVCPWNRKAPPASEPALRPRPELDQLDLVELLGLSEEEFRRRFRGTALLRAKRSGLLRNACLVLGNRGDRSALPALERARNDADPVIADAARWAIERIQQWLGVLSRRA